MVGSGSWQRVNTKVPIRSSRYGVFDLNEGKEYQFRVLSANMYGTSESSEPSKPIKTLELRGKLIIKKYFLHGMSHLFIKVCAACSYSHISPDLYSCAMRICMTLVL